jgi:hypothetical protein
VKRSEACTIRRRDFRQLVIGRSLRERVVALTLLQDAYNHPS